MTRLAISHGHACKCCVCEFGDFADLGMMRSKKVRARTLIVSVTFLASAIVLVGIAFVRMKTWKPHASTTMTFEVLQYNVFGRPTAVSLDGQKERLQRIPAALQKLSDSIDVITFAEADINDEREHLIAEFRKQGLRYATSVLHDPDPFTSLINGGVLIVSRWPIIREAQHVYRHACHYSDCLAAKGVKYARVVKTVGNVHKVFNVFATHMQAWSTPQGREDRISQAKQMHSFVQALNISHEEPLIFGGDFNVDNTTYPDEVANLINLLKASSPQRIGSQLYTSDPHLNVLVGRDGAATSDKCFNKYTASWGPEINGTYYPNGLTRMVCNNHSQFSSSSAAGAAAGGSSGRGGGGGGVELAPAVFVNPQEMCYCPCCPSEWLDYVLYAQPPYQQPVGTPTLECRVNQVTPFVVDWTTPKSTSKMQLVDLSDHFPVWGQFEFTVTPYDENPLNWHPDGCSSDADCVFDLFRCYCAGPNCFFQGRPTSGFNYGWTHPVNRNCLYQKTHFECLCGPT